MILGGKFCENENFKFATLPLHACICYGAV